MGRTLKAISDRVADDTKSYHPGELADGRFADLSNPPSLAALKLHEILFKAAGAAVADDRWHQLELAAFRKVDGVRNYDRKGIISLFRELRGVVMEYDANNETIIAGLIDIAKVEFEDGAGPAVARWKFGEGFREIVAQSDYWALIDRSASLAMTSRYALRLHQLISLRGNLDYKASETFKLDDIRARLGVPAGKLVSWSSLSQKALRPAVEEVNQLSRFNVTMTPKKRGRSVVAVEFTWEEKLNLKATKDELSRHSIGRKTRLTNKTETVVEGAPPKPEAIALKGFPLSGGISFTPWANIARAALPTHIDRPDVDLVADAFRQWATAKRIPLEKNSIRSTFEGFCRNWQYY